MYGRRNDRFDRPDPRHVVPSRHCIFIRGLPGTTDTTKLKEHLSREVGGPCSVEFFSTSDNGLHLSVAIRFDSHDIAKSVLEKYHAKKLLGYNVHVNWFKDLKRGRTRSPPGSFKRREVGNFRSRGTTFRGSIRGQLRAMYDRKQRDFVPNDRQHRKRSTGSSASPSTRRRSGEKHSRSRSGSPSQVRNKDCRQGPGHRQSSADKNITNSAGGIRRLRTGAMRGSASSHSGVSSRSVSSSSSSSSSSTNSTSTVERRKRMKHENDGQSRQWCSNESRSAVQQKVKDDYSRSALGENEKNKFSGKILLNGPDSPVVREKLHSEATDGDEGVGEVVPANQTKVSSMASMFFNSFTAEQDVDSSNAEETGRSTGKGTGSSLVSGLISLSRSNAAKPATSSFHHQRGAFDSLSAKNQHAGSSLSPSAREERRLWSGSQSSSPGNDERVNHNISRQKHRQHVGDVSSPKKSDSASDNDQLKSRFERTSEFSNTGFTARVKLQRELKQTDTSLVQNKMRECTPSSNAVDNTIRGRRNMTERITDNLCSDGGFSDEEVGGGLDHLDLDLDLGLTKSRKSKSSTSKRSKNNLVKEVHRTGESGSLSPRSPLPMNPDFCEHDVRTSDGTSGLLDLSGAVKKVARETVSDYRFSSKRPLITVSGNVTHSPTPTIPTISNHNQLLDDASPPSISVSTRNRKMTTDVSMVERALVGKIESTKRSRSSASRSPSESSVNNCINDKPISGRQKKRKHEQTEYRGMWRRVDEQDSCVLPLPTTLIDTVSSPAEKTLQISNAENTSNESSGRNNFDTEVYKHKQEDGGQFRAEVYRISDSPIEEDKLLTTDEKLERIRERKEALSAEYKRDCETFTTVVRTLISKDAELESKLLNLLKEILQERGHRCVEELRGLIAESQVSDKPNTCSSQHKDKYLVDSKQQLTGVGMGKRIKQAIDKSNFSG